MDILTSPPQTLRDSARASDLAHEALGVRIRRLRKLRKNMGQEEIGAQLNVSRETVSRWESGINEPSEKHIHALAKLLRVSPTYLRYGGPGGPKAVFVLGHVGAGASVFPIDDGPFEQIEAPFETPDDTIALIVRGDSMMPELSDGDYLLYRAIAQRPEDLIGKRCIVQLEDGQLLVKRLRRGRSFGCYDLDSTNAAPIENQRLQWIAKVEAVKFR